MTLALWMVGAYLLGAIPASYLAARLGAGIDLRQHGSNNLGATNLYRVMGWRYAVPVAVFDVAKGFVPVFLAGRSAALPAWSPLAVGVAAVLGHVYPLYLRFRGGKGVATATGVMLGLAPLALAVSALIWLGTVATTRIVSLASMLGAIAFPVGVVLRYPDRLYVAVVGGMLALFIVYTHRSNIRRLIAGEEKRVGRRDGPAARRVK